eukprot:TRINITY_DN2431_c0_g1_i1.p1 TRINITY_DN2431_c0_g1~~TRINITY_DN2431_c0_g1_i1.p1  ORF type:complete len:162 (+),score=24.17 TRINITY_DN2431_c0_g1_i1:662-1147(+)
MVGTLPYMSPEILQGNKYGAKSDWWSIGVIAYEMSHARRPFSSGRNSVEQHVSNQNPVSYRCSSMLEELIKGFLTENPNERFAFEEAKVHPFFEGIDWEKVKRKEVCATWKPKPNEAYFLQLNNMNEVLLGGGKASEGHRNNSVESQQELFREWDWAFGNN